MRKQLLCPRLLLQSTDKIHAHRNWPPRNPQLQEAFANWKTSSEHLMTKQLLCPRLLLQSTDKILAHRSWPPRNSQLTEG